MIPALEWHLLFRAFSKFAALARQYHFYEDEIARMGTSLLEMSPYEKHHEKRDE